MKKKDKGKTQKVTQEYKHSYGHYRTEKEAYTSIFTLKREHPRLDLQVVKEKRKRSNWKEYCVCVMIPIKGDKVGSKKVKPRSKKGRGSSGYLNPDF